MSTLAAGNLYIILNYPRSFIDRSVDFSVTIILDRWYEISVAGRKIIGSYKKYYTFGHCFQFFSIPIPNKKALQADTLVELLFYA